MQEVTEDGKRRKSAHYTFPTFAEATAVPSHPKKGRLIRPGLVSSDSTMAHTALNMVGAREVLASLSDM